MVGFTRFVFAVIFCGVVGIPLSQVKLPAQCTIAAILRDGKVTVPGGNDAIKAGDSLVVIAPHGAESKLKKIFLK